MRKIIHAGTMKGHRKMNIAIDSTNGVTIAPDSYSAATTGAGVDLVNCYGKGQAILLAQATTGDTIGAKIQDSADNATFADVSGLAFTNFSTTAQSQKLTLDKSVLRRYVRAITTTTGGTGPHKLAVAIAFQK
jgi:hypothetical protein